jgi:hypothetical protein
MNMKQQVEPEVLEEKLPQSTLSTTNPTYPDIGTKLERPQQEAVTLSTTYIALLYNNNKQTPWP